MPVAALGRGAMRTASDAARRGRRDDARGHGACDRASVQVVAHLSLGGSRGEYEKRARRARARELRAARAAHRRRRRRGWRSSAVHRTRAPVALPSTSTPSTPVRVAEDVDRGTEARSERVQPASPMLPRRGSRPRPRRGSIAVESPRRGAVF